MRKQKQLATPIYGKQSFLDKLISYKKKPGSLIMAILVMLSLIHILRRFSMALWANFRAARASILQKSEPFS